MVLGFHTRLLSWPGGYSDSMMVPLVLKRKATTLIVTRAVEEVVFDRLLDHHFVSGAGTRHFQPDN